MTHHNGRLKRPDRQVILARDGEEYHLSLRLGYEEKQVAQLSQKEAYSLLGSLLTVLPDVPYEVARNLKHNAAGGEEVLVIHHHHVAGAITESHRILQRRFGDAHLRIAKLPPGCEPEGFTGRTETDPVDYDVAERDQTLHLARVYAEQQGITLAELMQQVQEEMEAEG